MNIFNMAKDLKGMEKMMKTALEKFMKDSGFVKKDVLDKLEKRVSQNPPSAIDKGMEANQP